MTIMTMEERVKANCKSMRESIEASRIQEKGFGYQKGKLASQNFDKLMTQRGLTKEQIAELKESIDWKEEVQVRHAKAGEKFIMTHGMENSSGNFVSEKSQGLTPEERINVMALPDSNTAEYETQIELSKDQNLIYSKIAPQPQFTEKDPKHLQRNGGGEQVITDGGYKMGAVNTKDPKYPIPVKESFLEHTHEYSEKVDRNTAKDAVQNIEGNEKDSIKQSNQINEKKEAFRSKTKINEFSQIDKDEKKQQFSSANTNNNSNNGVNDNVSNKQHSQMAERGNKR